MKLKRLPDTLTDLSASYAVSESEDEAANNNVMDGYSLNETWVMQSKGPQPDQHLLYELGCLTGTTIKPRPNTGKWSVTISGEDPVAISKARNKLEIVTHILRFQAAAPFVTNLSHCELSDGMALQMMPIRQLEDRRLATTLLSPSHPMTKGLGNLMCIVQVSWDVEGKMLPISQPNRTGRSTIHTTNLWSGHRFKAFQARGQTAPDLITLKTTSRAHPRTAVKATVPTIDEWLNMNLATMTDPQEPLLNPFEHLPQDEKKIEEQPEVVAPSSNVMPHHEEPERKRHVKKRRPKGAPALDLEEQKKKDEEEEAKRKTKTFADEYEAPKPAAAESRYPPSKGRSAKPEKFTTLPTLAEPYMPPDVPQPSLPTPFHLVHAQVDITDRLIDFEDDQPQASSSSAVPPRPERDLRQTMRQKKGNAGSPAIDASLQRTKLALINGLHLFRLLSGHTLDLSILVGRVLIDLGTSSQESNNKTFGISQWDAVFSKKANMLCDFTPRLTTNPSDIDFILRLKFASQRQLFEEIPRSRSVVYCFHLQLSQTTSVLLELNEDGDHHACTPPQLVGAINWHYTKRYWDARLELKASKIADADAATLSALIEKISIMPSANGETVKVVVEDAQISIQSIHLRRETVHASTTYQDISIRLTHVEQLDIMVSDGSNACTAQPQATAKAVKEGKAWWEASLISTTLSKLFKGNEDLELGEVAEWQIEDVLESDALRHLELCSQDLVTRIDTVGYHNHGPKTSSGTGKSSYPQNEAEREFW